MNQQDLIKLKMHKFLEQDFKSSLIRSNQNDAFNKEGHSVVAMTFKGFRRSYFLVPTKEDLEKLKLLQMVEAIFVIPNDKVSKMVMECPYCGFKQAPDEWITECPECKKNFCSPGSTKYDDKTKRMIERIRNNE